MPVKPKTVCKTEEDLEAAEKKLGAAAKRYHARTAPLREEIASLRAKLIASGKCSHAHVREYEWRGSNGFGTHYIRHGLKCQICGFQNAWPGSSELWGNPDEMHNRDDD